MIWNWWVLLLIVPCWIAQNTFHELAHLISMRIYEKRKPEGLWPLWHWLDWADKPDYNRWRLWCPWELWRKPWPEAHFYFARCRAERRKKPRRAYHPTPFAPVYGCVIVLSFCVTMMVAAPKPARIFFVPQAACALVDMLNWWRGFFWGKPRTDGQRWRHGD